MSIKLNDIYQSAFHHFGKQKWWPADTTVEIIVGTILTQNTAWANVEKAIFNLKKKGFFKKPKSGETEKSSYQELKKFFEITESELAQLIKPAGYFNQKAKRLKSFLNWVLKTYSNPQTMFKQNLEDLRIQLLNQNGIGYETADSILLYAGHYPIFVVDAYTKRILERHNFVTKKADYHEIQDIFHLNTKRDTKFYNEFHALIVNIGKNFCKKSKPLCETCPLKGTNWDQQQTTCKL